MIEACEAGLRERDRRAQEGYQQLSDADCIHDRFQIVDGR
jgi:hypothetical protein